MVAHDGDYTMRPGLPPGSRATAAVWLPLRGMSGRGAVSASMLTEESGSGATIALGTGTAPTGAAGMFSDAVQFGSGVAPIQVTLASVLTLPFTLECWIYGDTPGSTYSVIGQTSGANQVFYLESSWATITCGIKNAAGTLFTVANDVPFRGSASRWRHVRVVWTTAGGWLLVDGALVGYTTSAPANLAAATVGPIQIGGETGRVTSQWRGRIAEVRILLEADTSEASCSPNLLPARVSRGEARAWDIDVRQAVQTDTWTASGGAYYLAFADLEASVAGHLLGPDDVVGFSTAAAAGDALVTWTAAGNVADVQAAAAGANLYCVDPITARLYLSDDVSTYAHAALTVRCRFADRGLVCGGRYYWPVVTSSDAGARRTGYWNQAIPTSGGTTIGLAAQAPGLPLALMREDAGMLWQDAAVRARLVSPGLAWAEVVGQFQGLVAEQPPDDRDAVALRVEFEHRRLARVDAEQFVADRVTYPNVAESSIGAPFPMVLGTGHKGLSPVCVDTRPTTGYPLHKVTGKGLAAITHVRLRHERVASAIQSVDLAAGTFRVNAIAGAVSVEVDCDGIGGTSSIGQAQAILTALLGITEFGATWAVTAALQKYERRFVGDAVATDALLRICTEGSLFIYFSPQTGLWECRDPNPADAIDYTIRDEDIIAESVETLKDYVCRRVNMSAADYVLDTVQTTSLNEYWRTGDVITRAVKGDARYPATQDLLNLCGDGRTGFATAAIASAWLTDVVPFLSVGHAIHVFKLPKRFAGADIMDVLANHSSRRAVGGGVRYRVLEAHAHDGVVDVVAFAEATCPTSGIIQDIIPRSPATVPMASFFWGSLNGVAVADTVWAPVDTFVLIWPGDMTWPPHFRVGGANGGTVRARRIGGTADANLLFRLRDTTNSLTLATTVGHQAVAELPVEWPEFVNLPTAPALVQLEDQVAAGATGVVYTARANATETPGNITQDQPPPELLWAVGYRAGVTCAPIAAWTPVATLPAGIIVPGIPGLSKYRFYLRADGTGCSGFDVRIVMFDGMSEVAGTIHEICRWSDITTLAFQTADVASLTTIGPSIAGIRVEYRNIPPSGGASGIVYAAACWGATRLS